MNIYADKAGAVLYYYNHEIAVLQQGMNVVQISIEDFLVQYDAGLNGSPVSYRNDGWAYWQLNCGTESYTLYFDNLIGVYPEQTPAA